MRRHAEAMLAFTATMAILLAISVGASGGKQLSSRAQDAAEGKTKAPKMTVQTDRGTVTKTLPAISNGTTVAANDALGVSAQDDRSQASDARSGADPGIDLGDTRASLGCSDRDGRSSVRVNQDCSFRRQAENDIVFNPANPSNLLAGQNDSRVGFNQCGIDWSTDNGRHWGDLLPPFRQKINNPVGQTPTPTDPNRHTLRGGPGTLHTYDAGSDPAVAFDTEGRGYFSCVTFDVNTNASMIYVTMSPRGAQGSFFFNLAASGRRFIVVEDNSLEVFHDKELITVDTFADSRNKNNVYVTWTVFEFNARCVAPGNPAGQCASPIFGSMSTDNAQTWSTPEEISGASPLCFFGNFFDPKRSPNSCDFNQGSDPAPLPNGDLLVVFNNQNTAATNPNAQQLGVRCSPAGSSPAGTAHLNCRPPTKVGDDVIVGEPACDFGRGPEECIPGAFIRTNDFPRIAVADNGNAYVTWQDYRNGEFDIQLTRSTDDGATWASSSSVNPDSRLDHYFAAIDIARDGGGDDERRGNQTDRVGVSYFRTERVPNENVTPAGGFRPGRDPGVQARNSDYVLSGGRALTTPFNFLVLSPVFAPPDGIQAGFNGDYTGLTINRGTEAHPIWSDTRNADPFTPANGVVHDEDAFTTARQLPDGRARPRVGFVGRD